MKAKPKGTSSSGFDVETYAQKNGPCSSDFFDSLYYEFKIKTGWYMCGIILFRIQEYCFLDKLWRNMYGPIFCELKKFDVG